MTSQSWRIQLTKTASTSDDPQVSLAENFSRYRCQLKRTIASRMGTRMQQRVDPSDILQEAYLVASQRIEKNPEPPSVPFFFWIRSICHQTFSTVFERHFKTQKRAAGREEAIGETFGISQVAIDTKASPLATLVRKEETEELLAALDSLRPNDRQILYLRMIEQLTTEETSDRLGISIAATKKRHIRAFHRLVDFYQQNECSSEVA
ncbi:MAG: sigma-70 family RNA polymerase sigma factor [Planctomycetota bacterium]